MQHSEKFLNLVAAQQREVQEITIEQLRALQAAGTVHLIDIREESEWARGHLPGAQYIGRGVLERDIEARFPDTHTPLYLYCGGGFRSILSAHSLMQMGYQQVVSVAGGYRDWCLAGYPVVIPA
ncbi:MAG: rhodanese-like domain-containing protein [Aeromonas sp.]